MGRDSDGWMGWRGCVVVRTSVGKVLVVLLRPRLGLLEVLVLDLDKLDHFGECVVVCVWKAKGCWVVWCLAASL